MILSDKLVEKLMLYIKTDTPLIKTDSLFKTYPLPLIYLFSKDAYIVVG
jgi:hypothetical protein